MTKTRHEPDARNADDRGIIATDIVERSKVANDVPPLDHLGPIILASLMSTTTGACSPQNTGQNTGDTAPMQREASVDDLLTDPMMSALWHAYAITEADVRNLVTEIGDRLKGRHQFHHQSAGQAARCA